MPHNQVNNSGDEFQELLRKHGVPFGELKVGTVFITNEFDGPEIKSTPDWALTIGEHRTDTHEPDTLCLTMTEYRFRNPSIDWEITVGTWRR
jgi:hypothetical protein